MRLANLPHNERLGRGVTVLLVSQVRLAFYVQALEKTQRRLYWHCITIQACKKLTLSERDADLLELGLQ